MPKNRKTILALLSTITLISLLSGLAGAERMEVNRAKEADPAAAKSSTPLPAPPPARPDGQSGHFAGPNTTSGDILVLANDDYFPALLAKIHGARSNIDLAMFVFKTTKSAKDRPSKIIDALISAAQWGVLVRVFLEKSGYDEQINATNELTAKRLRDNGIKVFFDSTNVTTHTKIVVIDGRYSFVGSHNFTNAALKHNNELSLLVDSRDLAHKLTDYLTGLGQP